MRYSIWLLFLGILMSSEISLGADEVVIRPRDYSRALRNPLKGFRRDTNPRAFRHEYATITRCYLKWNDLENDESDGIERIREVCNRRWKDVEKHNIKVIPRVYLDWDKKTGNEYWPADMKTGDYSSEQFVRRVKRLIGRLGECWDEDPRVAWVQLAIIGYWGEHHNPSPDERMQKILGDAYTTAFKNKLIVVRHPWEFTDYEFGIHWDSWAHIQQYNKHGKGIAELNKRTGRWKIRPIEGEVAYDWGRYQEQAGSNPNDTLSDAVHRKWLINVIRELHCSGLGWVANYNQNDSKVAAGAEEVQKAFGYRFVIDEVRYPAQISGDEDFKVTFTVRNTGSAPVYYNWPIELNLLDVDSRRAVWKHKFESVDIRKWLPGDKWNADKQVYEIKPETSRVSGVFNLRGKPKAKQYILALAILDPAGMKPSVRFAMENYFTGGYHPIGMIGIGQKPARVELSSAEFDDPAQDDTLRYELR
ncbi:MAG: DUF4832 domain-containing protein [Planctomycetota bacterium]